MPKDTANPIPRQRPVSCRLCRTRKLRCSRESPCSNCVARRVRCELEDAVLPARVLVPSQATSVASPRNNGGTSTSDPDLVERIRKLEQIVERQQRLTSDHSPRTTSHASDIGSSSDGTQGQSHAFEELHVTSPLYSQNETRGVPTDEHLDKDVAWLESIYSGHVNLSGNKIPTNPVVFRSCPVQHIASAQTYITHNANSFGSSPELIRCVWLPQYAEAKILVQKYVDVIDHVHHVIHTPSIMSVVDEVYGCLSQQGQVKPGSIMLLLGIFASSTHSWVHVDAERGLFEKPEVANNQSPLWIKALEDVLDIAHRTAEVSTEGIQGIIISFFTLINFEGYSRRCRALYYNGLLLARELGLHCLDHPVNAARANTAQTEMGRRVWWYLVASDWLISMVSGVPQFEEVEPHSCLHRGFAARFEGVARGIYQCHPRQMVTRKPLNINDEDIVDGMSRVEQPLSQPTDMTYSLLRIKLAEISRHITDRTPLVMGFEGGYNTGPSHDVVMDIDTEIQTLINEDLPSWTSMPAAEIVSIYKISPSKAAHIAQQGYMFRSLLYAQRCKLHFPFYNRGFKDATFATSRDVCLQSARLIIQTEMNIEYMNLRYSVRYKFIGLLMSVFMSSLVLLMDLCHNRSSSRREKQRVEISDALGILEAARHESEVAARFLDSLVLVLRKHKVSPTGQRDSDITKPMFNPDTRFHGDLTTDTSLRSASGCNGDNINMVDGEELSSYFNDIAQSFEQGDAESFDWDSIFSGLKSSFV
ncbi:hypothetical protein K504DRAFT_9431 [Pleomassaria siparia CBS 279.74]|uniref:Zn(2)-C6 fungal-type domain-containing protein n=1 Tax=Pleomassaria siparia CBS 279.74 TaxID=1314801 RepID=A0A6G1KQ59_9PLEO|nr:hypothetical protein K504DRAFT_9431 [Pleomassaria siparia CBS 279.74]